MKKLVALFLSTCLILGVCTVSLAAGSKKADAENSLKLLELFMNGGKDVPAEPVDEADEFSLLLDFLAEGENYAKTKEGKSAFEYASETVGDLYTALALYLMNEDAEDSMLDLFISALISYFTADPEPLRGAVKYARENNDYPEEEADDFESFLNSLDYLAEGIEDPADFNYYPLLAAFALNYLYPDETGLTGVDLLPAVISFEVNDDDPDDEYDELGFWLLACLASYFDRLNTEDDVYLTADLLSGIIDAANSGEYDRFSDKELKDFAEKHLNANDTAGLLAAVLGLNID